jgi:signal transduction histidine kinase
MSTLSLGIMFFIVSNVFLRQLYHDRLDMKLDEEIKELILMIENETTPISNGLIQSYELSKLSRFQIYDANGNSLVVNQSNLSLNIVQILQNRTYQTIKVFNDELYYHYAVLDENYIVYAMKSYDVYTMIRDILNELIVVILVISLLITSGITILFGRQIRKPIVTLNQVSKTLLKEDDRLLMLLKREDEIGELAKTLNQLKVSLNHTIKQLEQELQKEKQQDQVIKLFVAQMSHELKTPLSVGLAALEMIQTHPNWTNDQRFKYDTMLKNSMEQLSSITSDLLEFSVIQAKGIDIHLEQTSLKALFDPLIKQFPSVIFYGFDEDRAIQMDLKWMTRAFTNIISNALKYQQNGEVSCSLSYKKKLKEIVIKNKGILDAHINPFEPFIKSTHSSGQGLGLTIVKMVLDAHSFKYELKQVEEEVHFVIWF